MRTLLTTLFLLAASASALAVDNGTVLPEPGSLALVGIAGVAMAVAYFRKRK
jgi:PEP-CTERM motif